MNDWIVCGACGLNHAARPDGVCPRCRAVVASVANPYAAPRQPYAEIAATGVEDSETLREIALAQRRMLRGLILGWLGLLSVGFLLGFFAATLKTPNLFGVVFPLAYIPFIVNGYLSYRTASALQLGARWLWAIGGFLPGLLGLIVIAVLSSRATTRLRAAGLRVGFLGVSPDQLGLM